jgi:hypothetical protein
MFTTATEDEQYKVWAMNDWNAGKEMMIGVY